MKTRGKKWFRKSIILTVMASILISTNVIGVDASSGSNSVSSVNDLGYSIKTTVKYSGSTATGRGDVTNGGPVSMKVWVRGYYKSNGEVYAYGYKYDKNNEYVTTQSFSYSYTFPRSLCGARAKVKFSGRTDPLVASVGTVA